MLNMALVFAAANECDRLAPVASSIKTIFEM